MRMRSELWMAVVVVAVLGCGKTNPPTAATQDVAGKTYQLAAAPTGAMGVKAAKEESKDGDEIIIQGRVGGDVSPWIEGQSAFLVVDETLKPCNEKGDDACETPWDYCCDSDVLPQNKLLVKLVDANGKTLPTDARKLLNIKELQTVVVRGKAKRDDAGNLTVLADGVHVRN